MRTQKEVTRCVAAPTPIASLLALTTAATLGGPAALAQQQTAQRRDVLEEIIVSSQKLDRSLDDTAASATILDAEKLNSLAGLSTLNDVLTRLANVTDIGTSNYVPTVRGIDGTGPADGSGAFIGGTRPRFAYQVDGRPLSYNETVFGNMSIWDVAQIEMLRGPQSSLQGRNSIGGLIAVRTKEPTYDWEGGGRVMVGNFDARTASAYVSGPLAKDQLAFRISYDRQESMSWLPMAAYDRTSVANPRPPPQQVANFYYDPALTLLGDSSDFITDPGEYETTSARVKLLFEPAALDDFKALLTVSRNEHLGPQNEWGYRVEETGPFQIPDGRFATNDGYVESFPSFNPPFEPTVTSVILDSTLEVNDNVTLAAVFSYADIDVQRLGKDTDAFVRIRSDEFVAEPRIEFHAFDRRLTGVAGLYYFDNRQNDEANFSNFFIGTFRDLTETTAGFTEVTYALNDAFDITLGGRYEHEERERVGDLGFGLAVDFQETYDVFMPKAVLTFHASDDLTFGVLANRGYNGGGAAFTFNLFIDYTFDPEYVWNYEAFFRGHFLDDRVFVSANLFFADYEDFQGPYDINPGPQFDVVTVNFDGVESYGGELSVTALVGDGLELFADFGYTHARVTEFSAGKTFGTRTLPVSEFLGNSLARAPEFSAAIGASYHNGPLELGVDARHSGEYYSTIVNRQDEQVASFLVANLQAGYTFGNVRLFGYVKNVFDKDDPILINRRNLDFNRDGVPEITNIAAYTLLQPRTYMIGLEAKF